MIERTDAFRIDPGLPGEPGERLISRCGIAVVGIVKRAHTADVTTVSLFLNAGSAAGEGASRSSQPCYCLRKGVADGFRRAGNDMPLLLPRGINSFVTRHLPGGEER